MVCFFGIAYEFSFYESVFVLAYKKSVVPIQTDTRSKPQPLKTAKLLVVTYGLLAILFDAFYFGLLFAGI